MMSSKSLLALLLASLVLIVMMAAVDARVVSGGLSPFDCRPVLGMKFRRCRELMKYCGSDLVMAPMKW